MSRNNPPNNFLSIRCACLEYPNQNESDDTGKQEPDEIGSESGSFGRCGTYLGGLLRDISFSVGVMLVDNDWPFDGDGEKIFP